MSRRPGSSAPRVAIYARMSTDKQSDASPADQIAHCRRFAESRGWHVAPELIVQDKGISGASRHNRPALLALVDRIGEWDVLLAFDWSRITRNGEDFHWLRNTLKVNQRTAFEASTGLDIENVGSQVLSVMHEQYLTKLAADTHRGLRGKAERGLNAGGRAYGYRSQDVEGGKRLVIDDDQAETVRRIFAEFVSGESLRSIAHRLNGDGIASPRGKGWAVSALRSLILNPLYAGRYVWNRSEWIKDHGTGKRRRIERPESEWLSMEDESWRIVEPATWQAAQDELDRRGGRVKRNRAGHFQGAAKGHRTRSKRLLSGFLECGECGGGFFTINSHSGYGCGWHRDRGPAVCGSDLIVSPAEMEARFVDEVQARILTPDAVEFVVEHTAKRVREIQAARRAGQDEGRARLADLDRKLSNLADAIAEGGDAATLVRRVRDLEAERVRVAATLTESAPSTLDTGALRASLRAQVSELRAWFGDAGEGARRALRLLLGDRRLAVHADDETRWRVEGYFTLRPERRTPQPGKWAEAFASVVAGARFDGSEQPGEAVLPVLVPGRLAA